MRTILNRLADAERRASTAKATARGYCTCPPVVEIKEPATLAELGQSGEEPTAPTADHCHGCGRAYRHGHRPLKIIIQPVKMT